jgi:hypothetical protein
LRFRLIDAMFVEALRVALKKLVLVRLTGFHMEDCELVSRA